MATFKKTLSGDDRYYIELEVKEVTGSVSIEDNTSDVSYKLTATKKSGSGYYSNSAVNTVKVTIDGQDIVNKKMSYDFTGSTPKTITLASGTLNNIEHNADGTKSLSCKGYFKDGANSLGSGTASGSLTLSPIPRASSISVSGDIILGSPITIQISRASNDFLHELTYRFGNIPDTLIASGIGTSYQWTPPLNLAQQIPNADRGVMTITCYTYKASDSSLIGSKTLEQYAYVPNTLTPSISVSNPTISGDAPASWGLFVKGKSTATYTITGTGVQGSTISSYQSSVDGYTYTTANVTTNTLMTAGTNIINAKVIDSRGKQASTTKTINVVDYSNPTISTAQVQRCDVNGNIDNNGDYCYVSFSGSVTSLNSHNSGVSAYLIRYKTHDAQSYVNSVPVAAFVQNYSGTGMLYTDGIYPANRGSGTKLQLPSTNTYDIQFVVEDYFTEATNTQTLDTGFDLLNFNPSGKSMAIGKVSEASENEELLEVALDTEFSGTVTGETINFTSSNALDMLYGYISSILIGLFNSLGSSDALWDNLPKITETGTNIELNNSIEAPIRIKLNASETTQDTTTGKNLIGLPNNWTYNSSGIRATVNNDKIIISGTSTAVSLIDIPLLQTIPSSLGTLVKSLRPSGTYTGVQTSVRQQNANTSAGLWSNDGANQTSTLSGDAYWFRIQVNSGITINCTLQPQIELGSVVTNYEPFTYGASPNPNYPQEVHTITGNNIINVCGKNLIGLDTQQYKVSLKAGDKIYAQNTTSTALILHLYTNYGDTTRNDYWSVGTKSTRVITIANDSNAIAWNANVSSDGYAWVSYGETATTYEPYKENSYEVNLGKNLLPNNATTTTTNGITFTANTDGTISVSGTATATAYLTNPTFSLNAGTYTLSAGVYVNTLTRIQLVEDTSGRPLLASTQNASSQTFTTTSAKNVFLQFRINSGEVINTTFKPQLEKGSTASSYSPYFEPIELCKIGTYQDKIFKNTTGSEYYNSSLVENAWYKYKAIGKYTFTGSESWTSQSYGTNSWTTSAFLNTISNDNIKLVMSNIFYGIAKADRNQEYSNSCYANNTTNFFIRNTSYTTNAEVQSATAGNYVYFVLATPTYTQITNSELINQLEDLKNAHSYNKITNIMQDNSELPFILEVDVIDLQNLT